MAGPNREKRAAPAVQSDPRSASPVDGPAFPDCVFMYREGERAEVHLDSIGIMTALGWSTAQESLKAA